MPAISYLQRLFSADKFILFDIVQRQSRGWENRNKVLINKEPKWLSVPIANGTRVLIKDAKVSSEVRWADNHKNTINENYKKHPFYNKDIVDLYYRDCEEKKYFVDLIMQTLYNISSILDMKWHDLLLASDVENKQISDAQGPNKLFEICKAAGVQTYISGMNGKSYGIEDVFKESKIGIVYNPALSPDYDQVVTDKFIPHMGFFDYIFCQGLEEVKKIIKQPLITKL